MSNKPLNHYLKQLIGMDIKHVPTNRYGFISEYVDGKQVFLVSWDYGSDKSEMVSKVTISDIIHSRDYEASYPADKMKNK